MQIKNPELGDADGSLLHLLVPLDIMSKNIPMDCDWLLNELWVAHLLNCNMDRVWTTAWKIDDVQFTLHHNKLAHETWHIHPSVASFFLNVVVLIESK